MDQQRTIPVRLLQLFSLLAILTPILAQGEWPQWRGVNRDGSVSTKRPSGDWPSQLPLLWKRVVGGGYSGPVISGERIWVHSRVENQEVVSSLAVNRGELLWSKRYDAPFDQDPSARAHGSGPYSTPCLSKGRLFTLGVTTILSAWDARSGDLLWRRDYSDEFDPSFAYYGTAASPLVWNDLCFAHFGGHLRSGDGEKDRGALIALRVSDGSEAWRWERDSPSQGGSSLISTFGGQLQLVVKSKQLLAGLDPGTGEELWRIPYKVQMDNTICTPLAFGNLLITSDYQKGVSAWRFLKEDDAWTVRQEWTNPRVYMVTSSPVMVSGQLVGFGYTRSGELFSLDPSNGEFLWRGEPRWGNHASLISWGSNVLVLREDGKLLVVKISRQGFEIIRRYQLGDSLMWGHPSVANGLILIRDADQLAAYQLQETAR